MNIKPYIAFIAFLFSFTALQAQTQSGNASFYAKKFTGRRTANGERMHHDSLTCAHRTYPFGTLLRVTNPANGKQVIVRVTDRGPYVKGRIIDLSARAAREIGILAQGIAPVIVERYSSPVIPFKPEENIDLPEMEMGANEGADTKPLWMLLKESPDQQAKEEALAKQESQAKQENQARQKAVVRHDSPTTTHATKAGTHDDLKEINSTPNRSKAYMKRYRK